MPIDTRHNDHNRFRAKVQKTRDMIEGGQAAKSHIIKISAHDAEEYMEWMRGASFLPATERTLDAFVGMVMDPEPQVEAPDNFQELLDDISNNGEPFRRVCGRVVSEVLTAGRTCVVVDAPSEDAVFAASPDLARTAGNYAALGGRPYAKQYTFENILYWRAENIGGMKKLTELRLMEYVEVQSDDDEWVYETVPRIRVLDLFEGKYRQRVYKQEPEQYVDPDTKQTLTRMIWVQHGGDIFPRMGKNEEGQIPAIVFGPDTLDPEDVKNPPLLDLANLNCDHLQNSASLENTVRNLGCATLFIKAAPATDENGNAVPIRFGSNQAIIVPDGDAKLLSLGKDGVAGIMDVMERKEKQMVAIGARALMIDQQTGQVSTETERIRRAGEHSMLAQVANTVADGMTQVLQMLANWASIGGDITCALNTEFLPAGLQPGELGEWTAALQSGSISMETFLSRLKERGVVDPEQTVEDYREQLDEDNFGREFGGGDGTATGGGAEPPEEEDEDEEDE